MYCEWWVSRDAGPLDQYVTPLSLEFVLWPNAGPEGNPLAFWDIASLQALGWQMVWSRRACTSTTTLAQKTGIQLQNR